MNNWNDFMNKWILEIEIIVNIIPMPKKISAMQISVVLAALLAAVCCQVYPYRIQVARKVCAYDRNHFEGTYDMLDPYFTINGAPIYIRTSSEIEIEGSALFWTSLGTLSFIQGNKIFDNLEGIVAGLYSPIGLHSSQNRPSKI